MLWVCVKDIDNKDEEGKELWDDFYLMDNSLWKISDWALAMGWDEMFDPDDDDDIEAIMAKGVCVIEVKSETYQGKSNVKAAGYSAYNGEEGPEWDSIIEQGEEHFRKVQEWRARNPQGGSRSGQSSQSNGSGGEQDDHIPF